jgi:hypothetical protein
MPSYTPNESIYNAQSDRLSFNSESNHNLSMFLLCMAFILHFDAHHKLLGFSVKTGKHERAERKPACYILILEATFLVLMGQYIKCVCDAEAVHVLIPIQMLLACMYVPVRT